MKKIIMICTEGTSSNYIYNNVINDFEISNVILVKTENKTVFLKRRIKKLGLLRVIGQVTFMLYTKLFLIKKSSDRITKIQEEFNINPSKIPDNKIINVDSVNSEVMIRKLKDLNPDLVLVNGTPIIKKEILNSVETKFVNIHVGITPKYRGVHGGYWAFYNNDNNLAGVTTHLIDESIDSGSILDQNIISVTEKDNFLTYPHIQVGTALNNYNKIVSDLLSNKLDIQPRLNNDSKLWYHPTIFTYIYGRIFKKVK